MEIIKLPRGVWSYDPQQPLGPKGGFGIVFAGASENFGDLAIKQIFVEVQDAAHREIRIADELRGISFENVIPVYDAGQDAETGINYIVMARAVRSLQQEISSGRLFSEAETVETLSQIVNGLLEVPNLVHRDLKPGNILLHDGKWKIADFGIAKFVEESTSLRTLNDCLSPYYAAPEQWEYQRPTHAVDIYAIGCIGYALLTGRPPFTASTTEDLKQCHLSSEPPVLNIANSRLRLLLTMMLRKTSETRPSLERVRTLLGEIKKANEHPESSSFSELSNAAAVVLDQSVKDEVQRRGEYDEHKKREKIAREALDILQLVIDHLFKKICVFAPNAIIQPRSARDMNIPFYPERSISLGAAKLIVNFSRFPLIPRDAFKQSKWNVITGASIQVKQEKGQPYEWSANLWFTDLGKNAELRWWEVTYMTTSISRHPKYEPYAVDELSLADRAASPATMDIIQFGAKPKLVDDEAVDQFCDRWANLLAKAAKGELRHPSMLPID